MLRRHVPKGLVVEPVNPDYVPPAFDARQESIGDSEQVGDIVTERVDQSVVLTPNPRMTVAERFEALREIQLKRQREREGLARHPKHRRGVAADGVDVPACHTTAQVAVEPPATANDPTPRDRGDQPRPSSAGAFHVRKLLAIWSDTAALPLLPRLLCRGGMIVAPILLLMLFIPVFEWTIDGTQVSQAQLWRMGTGPSLALFLGLIATGCWGLAARRAASRWALVVAPLLPYALRAAFPDGATALEPWLLLEAVAAALVLYVALFQTRAVRAYVDGEAARNR